MSGCGSTAALRGVGNAIRRGCGDLALWADWIRPKGRGKGVGNCDRNEGKVRVMRNDEEDLDTTEKIEVDEKIEVSQLVSY